MDRRVLLSIAGYALISSVSADANYTTSPKRGLAYVSTADSSTDDRIWDAPGSDLTWYYDYAPTPQDVYSSNKAFEYVPMLWGVPDAGFSFSDTVKGLINDGMNITHVLGFNEPDGTSATGGSGIDPVTAAQIWATQIEPLKDQGVKLGSPAVTGAPSGFDWLSSFFSACDDNGGCSVDFMTVHWYGNFEGLASHLGQVDAAYPNMSIWVTEWALPDDSSLTDTQSFFNQSVEYMDGLDYVARYSYFGAFRSDVSNVGPNAAMLDDNGQLTDIGSWYLGGVETGNIPSGGSLAAVASPLCVLLATALAVALM